MAINPVLVIRLLQLVLAFIGMVLGANVANVFNTHLPASIHVPTAVVFFIFTAIFTQLITVPYTVVTPRYFQVLAHPYGMLLAEFTTSVFWLAGFAAVATRMGDSKICQIGACASARGCVAVGVLEFLLFAITAFFAFSHVFLGGRYGVDNDPAKQSAQAQARRSWSGAERV